MIDDELIEIFAIADPYKLGLQAQVIVGINVDLPHIHQVAEQLASLQHVRSWHIPPDHMI